jgi:hypothetical protein
VTPAPLLEHFHSLCNGRAAPPSLLRSTSAMRDLTSKKLIYAKGFLFLLAGALAAGGLLIDNPTPRTALLLALSIWCFARFYYFCFYVIEHYVDKGYRFAGLWGFARYLWGKRAGPEEE